jgi:hypothetical protein
VLALGKSRGPDFNLGVLNHATGIGIRQRLERQQTTPLGTFRG